MWTYIMHTHIHKTCILIYIYILPSTSRAVRMDFPYSLSLSLSLSHTLSLSLFLSLSICSYHLSLPAGFFQTTSYVRASRANVGMFLQAGQHWHGNVERSTGRHHSWVLPCFSCSVSHVLFIFDSFRDGRSVVIHTYIYIYKYIYIYILLHLFSRVQTIFSIILAFIVPKHVGDEVRKWIRIYNSSYLPELARKGYFTCSNNKERYRQ